jgi:hypothetical protein
LVRIATISTATKAGAKMLLAEATTPTEKSVAASAMAKVTQQKALDVLPEEEHAEELYAELLEFVPKLASMAAARGRTNNGRGARTSYFCFLRFFSVFSTAVNGPANGGSAPKKAKERLKVSYTRRYSASEIEKLTSLITKGSLDTTLDREAAAVTISSNTGIDLTEKQVRDWARNYRASKKKK